MKTSILVDREDVRKVEAQEQYLFVQNVLAQMELPLEECFPESNELEDFTIEHKLHLRKILDKFGVLVLDDRDGGVKIYVEKDLIAEWKKCRFELREDPGEIDPRKKLYAVIYIDYWTMFEEQEKG